MKHAIQFVQENFAFPFAFAGVAIYSLLIAVVNLEKDISEILLLMSRQAVLTFPVTGLLVPLVRKTVSEKRVLVLCAKGVLAPALVVTVVSTAAHWYFTDELRNVLAPFLLSAVLNAFLVIACRAGHMTFYQQAKFVLRGFR